MSDGTTITAAPAKELTEEERQAEIDKAFELEREIKAAVGSAHEAWWSLAESLYKFHELKGWKKLGYETLGEFLAQPDVGLGERTFHRAVSTWDSLHVRAQLPKSTLVEVEPSKAREVAPAIKRGDVRAEKAISDAKELSYRDVVEEYRVKSPTSKKKQDAGEIPDDAPAASSDSLAAEDEPVWCKCPGCQSSVTVDALRIDKLAELPARAIEELGLTPDPKVWKKLDNGKYVRIEPK